MRRLLLVASQYPPAPGAGGARTSALVRELPARGWQVSVLTPRLPSGPRADPAVLETALRDPIAAIKARAGIAPGQSVAETLGGPSGPGSGGGLAGSAVRLAKSALAYPDETRTWIRPAVREAERLLAAPSSRPSALLSTSPTVSGHVIAARLARRWGVPWVADLRDLWADNPYADHLRARKVLDRRLEDRTLAGAATLTTVSDELATTLRGHHPQQVVVIPNGVDSRLVRRGPVDLPERLTITHTGGLYGGKRNPEALFIALHQLLAEGEVGEDEVDVVFLGPPEAWLQAMIDRYDLGRTVRAPGPVSQEQALASQRRSHLLLLLTWDDPADRGTCPAKLFEYMAARRPVLALGLRGSVGSRLVESTGLGRAHGTEDVASVREHLLDAYGRWRSGQPPQDGLADDVMAAYSQEGMAQRFAEVLDAAPPH